MAPTLDRSAQLVVQGYGFAAGLRHRHGADVVPTRLLGRPALVVGGRDSVRRFYDSTQVRRDGAVSRPLRRTLLGDGPVHALDDDAHLHRKAMFLSLVGSGQVASLRARADQGWQDAATGWARGGRWAVYDEAVTVLGSAVMTWVGLPAPPEQAQTRAWDLAAVVDGFGSLGPAHVKARRARRRTEGWMREAITDVRAGRTGAGTGTALHVIAHHRDPSGDLLDVRTATTELHNVLRPTVAVSWFVSFVALALYQHPQWRQRLRDGDGNLLRAFAHEVRRLFPFVPVLAARARHDLDWDGHHLPAGGHVILDVHGTNHDPRYWPNPDTFDRDRFVRYDPDPYTLVPQGGGDRTTGHRCPGEDITIELLAGAVHALTALDYDVPAQDLTYSLRRVPTRPRSGGVITDIRAATTPT